MLIDIIDVICRKDEASRDHVAGELDVPMDENKSTVTKMWKHRRRMGHLLTNMSKDAAKF